VVHERNQLVQHSTVALPQLLEQCGYGLRHRAIIPRRGGWGLGPGRPPPYTPKGRYTENVDAWWNLPGFAARYSAYSRWRTNGPTVTFTKQPWFPPARQVLPSWSHRLVRRRDHRRADGDARRAEDRCIRIFAALRHADSSGAFPAVAKTHTLLLCSILNTPVRLI
jgi:hypothetical protein